ncbi:MAG: hypothetical protein KF886_14840 [Candidatus Hydrogenedentes bacterium]|nr:hypothetical protein [Candidatus Hydrogenedentota bacterium]
MSANRDALEAQLNDFSAEKREEALDALLDLAADGLIELPEPTRAFNLHCHSFFSFNGYGYSPTALAWIARCKGLSALGIVDFDVVDGVDEFLSACKLLGIRAGAGMETRIFIPEFADRVINSPGEPGICYYMASGLTTSNVSDGALVHELKRISAGRTRNLVERVNTLLDATALDFEADVLPLTPNGNATERHVCAAYDARAKAAFPDPADRAAYWAKKLDTPVEKIAAILDDGPALQGLIRSKTMKSGGVGYVQPDGADFPRMEQVNQFAVESGGFPMHTWLDGLSDGEQAIEELLDLAMGKGAAALNIIPDRNWNIADPAVRAKKVEALHHVVRIASDRNLPVMVGTELNAHGQPFADNFDAPEMAPLFDSFQRGAFILHAHTVLQSVGGMGYLSPWAARHFPGAVERNAWFAKLGAEVLYPDVVAAEMVDDELAPDRVLEILSAVDPTDV